MENFTFRKLVSMFVRRWWVVAICAILGYFGGVFLGNSIPKMYKTSAQIMFVSSDSTKVDDAFLNKCQRLMSEGNEYFKKLSNKLNGINQALDIGTVEETSKYADITYIDGSKEPELSTFQIKKASYGSGELNSAVSVSVDGDGVFTITVSSTYAEDTAAIANLMLTEEMMNEVLLRCSNETSSIRVDNFKIFTRPSIPGVAVNEDVSFYHFAGFGVGIFLSAIIVFIIEKADVRVKGEEDLQEKYNIPVLGVIPVFPETLEEGK